MKRSEAVELIAQELKVIDSGSTYPISHYRNDAGIILTKLEGAGLQPPNITIKELIPGLLTPAPGTEVHFYACWEPEA